ncbi:hypothetical protein AX16_006301 [Volvariella volvacea WC 439]|nr:hypothetical protein AX16_006301 [Volvariella volvacea WC 439]
MGAHTQTPARHNTDSDAQPHEPKSSTTEFDNNSLTGNPILQSVDYSDLESGEIRTDTKMSPSPSQPAPASANVSPPPPPPPTETPPPLPAGPEPALTPTLTSTPTTGPGPHWATGANSVPVNLTLRRGKKPMSIEIM